MRERTLAVLILFLVGRGGAYSFDDDLCTTSWICSPESVVVNEDGALVISSDATLRSVPKYETAVRVTGEIERNGCEDHLVIVSTSPSLEWAFDFIPDTIFATWQCDELYLVGSDGFDGVICESSGLTAIELDVGEESSTFRATWEGGNCSLSIAQGLAKESFVSFGARPINVSFALWNSIEIDGVEAAATPTSAPTCTRVDTDERSFSLVGGSYPEQNGLYVLDQSSVCGCRPVYECITCEKEDVSISFDEGLQYWTAASGGCGGFSSDNENPLVAPDALADSPFEIASFWFEPDALSGEYFSNATLEVSYSIDILGKALSEDNQVLWFGRYDRRGLCADRPYFVGGDERFMYYVESFELWVIGGIGCGDTTTIGLYASSTAPSPLSIAGDVWFEALDEFVENPSISVAFVDFAPSAQPTTLAPSISPAPTTSPAPSTAAPTPAPAESIGFSSVDGCAQDGWTLCENEDIRSEEPLFRQRMVRAKGRIVKDRVCDNHRLFFTESPEETYARLINLEETIQIGWDCDTLFILGPTQTSFSACPQDTYDVEVVVDNAFTTINATGLFAECFVQIDEGLDDTTQDVGELLYAYIGASDGAAWTWISITEEIDEENATPFPTPLLVDPTDPPEPAAVSFANITCGFEEEEKNGLCDAWISGAPGVLGWRFSTDVDTTTPDTGPTSPFSGTVYAYVEASYAFPEVGPFVLESHPLLIRDDEAAILSFRYHMFGEHVGNLSLQVLDSTTIWMSVWSRVGSQGEDWLEGEIEVPATSEQIRFVAYTEFGELGDIALDEIVASYAEIVPTSAPSLSPMPTVTSSPTTSFVPTTAPTALPVVATRTDIEDQILMGEAMVWIESSAIVDFSDGLVFVSESDVAIGTQPNGQTAILDGGGASRIFGVFDVSLSLRDLILRNGYSDNLGGLLVASSASSLDIYRCILESGVALVGGALFAQDNSVVTVYNTTFSNSTALSSGGAIFVRNSASLAMENCVVADNEALEPGEDDEGGGGGIGVENGAFLSLVQVQLVRNTVNGSAGAILIDQQSTVDVTGGSFENNTATLAGGAMLVTKSSTLRLSDTLFLGNIAENRGGAIMVQASSSVVAEETQFLMNIANNVGGGAVQAITSGSFTAKSSTFRENQAPRGGAIEIDSSGVVTLFESTFAENFAEDSDSNWINCAYRGTVYSAKVNIDDLQTFSAVNCAGYLYQFNNDGSPEFLNRTIGNIVREQGSVDITHYTYPCDAGKFSSDGLEHGNAIVDVNGLSINENDPDCIPGCTNEACQCAESCEVCPAGTYLPFSLDKFRSTNIESCVECPVGRFLSDDAQDPLRHDSLEDCEFCPPGRYTDITGSSECFECKASTFSSTNGSTFCETSAGGFFVNEAGASKSLPCPEGRFSVGGAKECSQCTPGSFQSDSAQTVCTVVSPGYFAFDEGAVDEAPCPAGSVSGSGASECSPCDVGRFQRLAGQTECFLSSPGTFVNETGSTSSYNCPAGRYAPSANQSSCDDCPIGTYCDSEGQASAPQCPFPTTTSGAGSTFCDACVPGFYWDTVYWEEHKDTDCADEPCVDACVDCDEIDPDGVDCDVPGIRLESIPVHEGWWRATKLSTEVYECRWKDACKGGNDTSTSAQCARAYTGALCGACKNEYDYDSFQGKCVKCKPAIRIVGSPGTITFIVLFALAIILIVRHYGLGKLCAGLKQTFLDVLTDKVDPRRVGKKGVELASKRKKSDGSGSKGDELESSDEDDESPQEYRGQQSLGQLPQPASSKSVGQIEQEKRERFWTSVMTKVKICLAVYQIISATPWTLPGVNWPEVTEAVLKAVSIFELNFVQLGSTDCVLRLSYFEKLAVVTIFPFVLAIILPLMYYGMLWIRRRCFSASIDYALERRRVIYGLLLLFYVALPGCASYTFRYFSCLRFERGVGRPDLKALAIDLTIKCGSPAYHRWFPFVVLMILIWPVGCPLVVGLILWSRRHRLDPPLVAADMPRSIGANIPSAILEDNDEELIVEFYRAQRHFKTVVRQLAKIEKRNQDVPLKAIEFLYEEYEPRTFLFPVFEAVRRIFLTGVLAMFYPGSMSQVTVGLFGSMISYRVFSYFQPYIDDDDDIVSEVAQTQLVILFFAAMIVFVSENADSKDGIMQSQAFGIVLLLVFSASFLVAVYFVLVNVFGHEEVRRVASKTLRLRSRRSSTTDLLEEEEEEEDAKVDAANAAARKTTTSQPSFLSVVSKERSTTAFSDLIRDDDDDQDEINEDDDQDKEDDDEMKC